MPRRNRYLWQIIEHDLPPLIAALVQLGASEWVVSHILDAQLPECFACNQRVSCLRRHLIGIDNCGRMYAAKHVPSNSMATSRERRTVPGFLVTFAAGERGGMPACEPPDLALAQKLSLPLVTADEVLIRRST